VTFLLRKDKDNNESSHIDDINMNFSNEKFRLKDILKFCYKILTTLLTYNQEKIKYIKPILECEVDIMLCSDPLRLKQILLNLISNAVKFTKKGYIKIKAEILNEQLIISIEDTGIGIENKDKPLIFTSIKMLNSNMNKLGSGIGLTISRYIAEGLGFNLNFDSAYSKGSTFSLIKDIKEIKEINDNVDIIKLKENSNSIGLNTSLNRYSNSINKNNKPISKLNYLNNQNILYNNSNNSFNIENSSKEENETVVNKFDFIDYSTFFNFKNKKSLYEKEIIIPQSKDNMLLDNKNKKKILIIDDNNTILNSMYKLLTNYFKEKNTGIEVIKCNDGYDLISYCMDDYRNNTNDIIAVFTDENMEYINGIDAVTIIKKIESKNRIKNKLVFLLSAINDLNNYSNTIFDEVIDKPLKIHDLNKIFNKYNL
jgi:hypothetical protein